LDVLAKKKIVDPPIYIYIYIYIYIWAGHVARMGERRGAYGASVGKVTTWKTQAYMGG
jgi:hypothetical protein